jgi:hypothetical protein
METEASSAISREAQWGGSAWSVVISIPAISRDVQGVEVPSELIRHLDASPQKIGACESFSSWIRVSIVECHTDHVVANSLPGPIDLFCNCYGTKIDNIQPSTWQNIAVSDWIRWLIISNAYS